MHGTGTRAAQAPGLRKAQHDIMAHQIRTLHPHCPRKASHFGPSARVRAGPLPWKPVAGMGYLHLQAWPRAHHPPARPRRRGGGGGGPGVLGSANPRMDSEGASGCPWSMARATAPSLGQPTPGVVKQDKSSGGSVDTTKTRLGPQRVWMCNGEGPIGTAKGKQTNTMALCHRPPCTTPDALSRYRRHTSQQAQVPPPPSCISYALVQATVGVGTVIIVYVILIAYEM